MTNSTAPITTTPGQVDNGSLPSAALLIMALMGFVLIASETMPAGLLPQIAAEMNISEATAGQLVTAYALGTVTAAIPATAATRGLRRKPLAVFGMLGILAANVITAVSPDIMLSLGVRLFAGACSGLLWGILAGYARRISPPDSPAVRCHRVDRRPRRPGVRYAAGIVDRVHAWLALLVRHAVGRRARHGDPDRGLRAGRAWSARHFSDVRWSRCSPCPVWRSSWW